MKDEYDFSKTKQIPHPFLHSVDKDGNSILRSNIRDISDEEFSRKLQDLEPEERELAMSFRHR